MRIHWCAYQLESACHEGFRSEGRLRLIDYLRVNRRDHVRNSQQGSVCVACLSAAEVVDHENGQLRLGQLHGSRVARGHRRINRHIHHRREDRLFLRPPRGHQSRLEHLFLLSFNRRVSSKNSGSVQRQKQASKVARSRISYLRRVRNARGRFHHRVRRRQGLGVGRRRVLEVRLSQLLPSAQECAVSVLLRLTERDQQRRACIVYQRDSSGISSRNHHR